MSLPDNTCSHACSCNHGRNEKSVKRFEAPVSISAFSLKNNGEIDIRMNVSSHQSSFADNPFHMPRHSQVSLEVSDRGSDSRKSASDADAHAAQVFIEGVKTIHAKLVAEGMDTNEAAALALKLAAGIGKMPVTMSELQSRLTQAKADVAEAKERQRQADERAALLTPQPSPASESAAGCSDKTPPETTPPTTTPSPSDPTTAPSLQPATETPSLSDSGVRMVVTESGRHLRLEQQSLARAAHSAFLFFSNQESLHAAFWTTSDIETLPLPPPSAAPGFEGVEEERKQLQRLDMDAVRRLYEQVLSEGEPILMEALKRGLEQLLDNIRSSSQASSPGLIRQLLIILACPILEDIDNGHLIESLSSVIASLSTLVQGRLVAWLSSYSKSELSRLVVVFQQYVTLTLYQRQAITKGVEDATKSLGILHRANEISRAIPFQDFYNDAVNNEDFNLKEDFRRWKNPYQKDSFSFCSCPFVYDPSSKARVLQMENQMQQFNELQGALFRGLVSGGDPMDLSPFLVLRVRRGPNLVQDTLLQINRAKEQDALKKPLKVKFLDEEGVDEGGVQKEFFQLLIRELFDPVFGMFSYDDSVSQISVTIVVNILTRMIFSLG